MQIPVLELRSVTKSFGGLEILKGVNMAIYPGSRAVIVGPSGAGKSTLLHIAGLMEAPSEGQVLLKGREVSNLSEKEKAKERLDRVGFLFQFHYLLPDFDVLENVIMPARLAGDNMTVAIEYAKEFLDRLGLSGRLSHLPAEISGGEQQRAALARALVRRPKLLLCDEPTGNLDQKTAKDVVSIIWSETNRQGVAAVVVTHNEALAQQADQVFRLEDGVFRDRSVGVKN